jgi:nucleoid-associated protein YgaU
MFCPVCRKDTRKDDQIICSDCKANNPYNLLGGYSTTKSISEELKKIGPYEEQIKQQKKQFKIALTVMAILSIGLILSLLFSGQQKSPIEASSSGSTQKLEQRIMELEGQLVEKEQELAEAADSKAELNATLNTSLRADAKQSLSNSEHEVAKYNAELKSLELSNSAKDQEIVSLKAQVKELNSRHMASDRVPTNLSAQVHVVSSGESLSSIALKYYKSENKISVILEDNDISDADKIYVGQKLKIRK